jgi:hypothetical protein
MTELAKWVDFMTHAALRTKGVYGSQAKPDMIGRLVAVLFMYGLAAFVGGIVLIHFPAEAVFLPLIALLPVILDAFKHQRSQRPLSKTGLGIGKP